MNPMTNLRGTCHCGAVELVVRLPDGLASARRCDCSYCRRRGAIVESAPLDHVVIVKGADNLTLYQWALERPSIGSARPVGFIPTTSAVQTRCNMASTPVFSTVSARAILPKCR